MDENISSTYLDRDQIINGVSALKNYIKKLGATRKTPLKKNLLEAGDKNNSNSHGIILEVVFKNIPSNEKTYVHNVRLPHHWRLQAEPEDSDIAIFVKHRKPKNEAEKIQFSRDRDLDIDNTHQFYKELFDEKLSESMRQRISRIISTKELATEFNTFQKMDRLSKSFDLYLSDKKLMVNKMNPLPRRLGRRFWVRERKVPIMLDMDAENLDDEFVKALSTESFYVVGRSATEHIQVGIMKQSNDELANNIAAFLEKLYRLYGNHVRFLKLKSQFGHALPLYADMSLFCPVVRMSTKRIKQKPVIDDFDMLEDDAKIIVRPSGEVKVIKKAKGE